MGNVVVTGGGTIAPIDDVRAITNASSGRFSAAISEACLARGARVWHVHTPSTLLPFGRLATMDLDAEDQAAELRRLEDLARRYRRYRNALELVPLTTGTVSEYENTLRRVLQSHPVDVVFLAMAASDYEPVPVPGKIDSDAEELLIRCQRAPKVIQSVRDWTPNAYLVGFKLLSGSSEPELIRSAELACRVNRVDLTVANDLRSLRAGRHRIHLVRPGQPTETYQAPEDPIAERLVERVLEWSQGR